VGDEGVAAAGFAAGDQDAVLRIADAAVAILDRCARLLEDADHKAEFRMGVDVGVAVGSPVGRGPRIFNLWGEAVRTAEAMADTALPGAVQVTEAAYDRLAQAFLFRPRGRYWLPRVGEAQTYGLVGRL
jgi:adenylate cyclase